MAHLSPEAATAFDALLDTLIPPRDEVAGAGGLGLAATILDALATMPGAIDNLQIALTALDATAGERGAPSFAELPEPGRADLLGAHAESDPGFLPGLIFQTYVNYYREPAVLLALGQEARPPAPLGYPIEPSDLESLTERVRKLPKLFRET